MIREKNEYLLAKRLLKIDVGDTEMVEVGSKEVFRKYLSDLAKRNQMQFITRTPANFLEGVLEVSRFK